MTIKFTTAADRLDFISKYNNSIKIVNAEQIEDSIFDSYHVTFEIDDSYSLGQIAQMFFHAGISYGLDLNYSSYDNEPARVR